MTFESDIQDILLIQVKSSSIKWLKYNKTPFTSKDSTEEAHLAASSMLLEQAKIQYLLKNDKMDLCEPATAIAFQFSGTIKRLPTKHALIGFQQVSVLFTLVWTASL